MNGYIKRRGVLKKSRPSSRSKTVSCNAERVSGIHAFFLILPLNSLHHKRKFSGAHLDDKINLCY